ncbi:hypothetical protein D3C76_795860 [compost metagenome]
MHLVEAHAGGEHGVVGHIGFEHTVEERLVGGAVVDEVLTVLVGHHRPATQLAIEAQRAGHVQLAAVVVPAARRGGELELVEVQRALAHQVDDAARVAGAAEQRTGAAQHFDVVEFGDVVDVRRIEAACSGAQGHGRCAVELDVLDREAARVEVLDAERGALHGHARHGLHRIVDVGDLAVFDQLAGDDRHRLRGFLQRGRALGADAGQPRRVGAGVLGGLAHPLAHDGGFANDHGAGTDVAAVGADQHHRVVLDAVGQASAVQQLRQGLVGFHGAADLGRTLAADQVGRIDHLQAGLLAKGNQRLVQRLGRNVHGNRLGVRMRHGQAQHQSRSPQAPLRWTGGQGCPLVSHTFGLHVRN